MNGNDNNDRQYKLNHNYYDIELSYIKDKELRDQVCYILDYLVHPDNFVGRASSTKKHHPPFANEVGGLVNHTRALVNVLINVFKVADPGSVNWDTIIAAGILHDCCKYEGSTWTNQDHAVDGAKLIRSSLSSDDSEELRSKIYEVADIVEAHMGRWDDMAGYTVSTMNRSQFYVHIADMIVSRSWYASVDGIYLTEYNKD